MIKREKTDTIVIHCSATPSTMDIGVEKIREWHVDENGWDDVGYHYIIKRTNGELETGRDEAMQGAHAVKVNHRSIAICLIGGSDANGKWENNFTDAQFITLKSLILDLLKRYEIKEDFKQIKKIIGHYQIDNKKECFIKKIIGHYQVDNKKECPSFKVPEWLEQNGLQEYIYIG